MCTEYLCEKSKILASHFFLEETMGRKLLMISKIPELRNSCFKIEIQIKKKDLI